jgi:hypothetical protein
MTSYRRCGSTACSRPSHEPGFDPADLLLYRGKREHVATVMVTGAILLENGRLTKVSKEAVYDGLVADAAAAAKTPYREMRHLWEALRPHVQAYFEGLWVEPGTPHYRYNSRTLS